MAPDQRRALSDPALLRELARYARIFVDLTPGQVYPAPTFVEWLETELQFESKQRSYNAPAGRPGQIKLAVAS
jgi:hypothetical protein